MRLHWIFLWEHYFSNLKLGRNKRKHFGDNKTCNVRWLRFCKNYYQKFSRFGGQGSRGPQSHRKNFPQRGPFTCLFLFSIRRRRVLIQPKQLLKKPEIYSSKILTKAKVCTIFIMNFLMRIFAESTEKRVSLLSI